MYNKVVCIFISPVFLYHTYELYALCGFPNLKENCGFFRYRHFVHWLSEGPKRTSRNCTNLLQWESMVRRDSLTRLERHPKIGVYTFRCTSGEIIISCFSFLTAIKSSTERQSLCLIFWTWTGWPVTGAVMGNLLACNFTLNCHSWMASCSWNNKLKLIQLLSFSLCSICRFIFYSYFTCKHWDQNLVIDSSGSFVE